MFKNQIKRLSIPAFLVIKVRQHIILSFIAFTLCQLSYSQNWNLVWQDEFTNGIGPDWVFETGTGNDGWGNQELQYYKRENAAVRDGQLIITAKRELYGGRNYTSARMKTQGRKSFRYGKIEARIALPSFKGTWPAFWALGNSISSIGWPSCGEIDVMEHVNDAPDIHGTMHWSDQNRAYAYYGKQTNTDVTQFHVYTVEWSPNSIKWFVDDRQYNEANIANGINGTSEFHEEFFLLLNMAIGGRFPGFEVDNSRLPAEMKVDYVRVYQAGTAPPPPTGVATIYQHCSYGGYAVGLGEGSYTRAQLIGLGAKDDDISSVKVQSGYQAKLYFDDNFTGTSIVKIEDTNCLVNDGFNDQVTSITISKTNGGGSAQVIEAEEYTSMSGVQTEACSEGGLNIGYIDAGDWMAYGNINFLASGNYLIEYRVASAVGGGVVSADLNAGATVLGQVNIPNTGGWQNWTTVSHIVNINTGTYPFGLYATSGGWNINWIKITNQGSARSFDTTIGDSAKSEIGNKKISTTSIFPNPFTNVVQFKFDTNKADIAVFDNLGRAIMVSRAFESGKSMDLSNLKKGLYLITIKKNGVKETKRLIKE